MRRAHQVSTKFMEIANENRERGERERERERESEREGGAERERMEKHSLGVSRWLVEKRIAERMAFITCISASHYLEICGRRTYRKKGKMIVTINYPKTLDGRIFSQWNF